MRILTIVLSLLAIAGCDRETAKSPQTTGQMPPTQTTGNEEPAPEPVELQPAIAQTEIEELFNTWLAAQNEGDFDEYSSVYADKFEGIKRVGPRMYRYNREGWLKDRARMFDKKMSVTSTDLQIDSTATMAVVVFQQTWASGSFKDTGPKQLVVTKTPAGLRVAREEMLTSHVDGEERSRPAYDPQAVALLVGDAVVLDIAPKRAWEKGAPKMISRPNFASKELDVEASGFGSWIGRDMQMFGPDGELCSAKIESLELRVRVIPHFGTVNWWNGVAEGEGEPRRSDAYVAAELWRMGSDPHYQPGTSGVLLVGELDDSKGCEGALWARPAGGLAVPLAARPLRGPAQRDVMASFTDLPGYHATQADYDAYGHRGPWHEDKVADVSFTKFGDWVVGTARAGWGCGGFEGSFWGLWRAGAQGSLILQTDDENPGIWQFAPKAAARVGDAVYFIEQDRIMGKVGDSWEMIWNVEPANYDCGC